MDKPVRLRFQMRYCLKHKKASMFDLSFKNSLVNYANSSKSLSICLMTNCDKEARWGYAGKILEPRWTGDNMEVTTYIFCQDHRRDDMVAISSYINMCPGPVDVSKRGPDGKCPLSKLGNDKYRQGGKKYCGECFIRSFPADPRTSKIRTKNHETRVMRFLKAEFPEINFIHDKPIWTGGCDCSHRRRIDFRALIGNTILAIEVDEGQHKQYESANETLRYDDLYMIFSGKWIFIRFNPDAYKNTKGRLVNCIIKDRLDILKGAINEQLRRIGSEENTELLEIHKLFFDNYT
jgi:hypothetical protein